MARALGAAVLVAVTGLSLADEPIRADGYRGIWYMNQPTGDEFVYKYSGGLGTYCAKHIPMAVYAPVVNRTFFVYGGTRAGENRLLEMVSYYDHTTRTVPRPVVLMDKGTGDAHDNPVVSLDAEGHVWVFASSHGTVRPSFVFRSRKPYEIDDFERILETNFSYPQPWYLEGKGFLFLHTYYKGGRGLNWQTSADGVTWSDRKPLAHMEEGHYQISWPNGGKVGTAFNYHPTAFQGDPRKKGLNWRTNMYYVETSAFGELWRTVAGEAVATPISDKASPCRVMDYEVEGWLCYVKDLNYDSKGRPVILHLVARTWEPGPKGGPREWRTAHWRGDRWEIRRVAESDHNYDTGCLHIEPGGTWRVIGPTEPGPQPYGTGGDMAVWTSGDEGEHWTKESVLTGNGPYNHAYARRPLNAHPGFYAFWADGHARQPSESRLYFYDKAQIQVFRLPPTMTGMSAAPEPMPLP